MKWLDGKDMIMPEQWKIIGIEGMGTTRNMCLVANAATNETGFFKPEREGFFKARGQEHSPSYYEYAASKIAAALDIPCAKILIGELFGKSGCISLDVRSGYSGHIITASSLDKCGKLFNYKNSAPGSPVFGYPDELSFQGMLPYLPQQVEHSIVKMMYFDCITDNPGRNSRNYLLEIDGRPAITALLPLYDNEFCIQKHMKFMREGSAFHYYGSSSFPFGGFPFEVLYECMQRDYPELANSLEAKAKSKAFYEATKKLGCCDFMLDRVNRFGKGDAI